MKFKKGDLVRMKEPFDDDGEEGHLFIVTEVRPEDLFSIYTKSLATGEIWVFKQSELEKANEEG